MLEPRQLHNVIHPFIDSMYLKKGFGRGLDGKSIDVLVIEAKYISQTASKRDRERSLLSFLADLDLIKDAVERQAGKFSRVDIRHC